MPLQVVGGTTPKSGISRLTTEFLYWTLTTSIDLSDANAEIAFIDDEQTKPSSQDWYVADIMPTPGDEDTPAVRILVGPENGDADLTPPTSEQVVYYVWVKIIKDVETIVRRAGTLLVR